MSTEPWRLGNLEIGRRTRALPSLPRWRELTLCALGYLHECLGALFSAQAVKLLCMLLGVSGSLPIHSESRLWLWRAGELDRFGTSWECSAVVYTPYIVDQCQSLVLFLARATPSAPERLRSRVVLVSTLQLGRFELVPPTGAPPRRLKGSQRDSWVQSRLAETSTRTTLTMLQQRCALIAPAGAQCKTDESRGDRTRPTG